MSYPTSSKGKGVHHNYQQHPQHPGIRYSQPRREDIGPRQRYPQQQAPRPQHPVPSQSPRIPSPSVSPVAVNALPHDMNKQGAPSRPGMSASPQQGILPNQPTPGPAPMLGMNPVRFQAPRGTPARFTQPMTQQQVHTLRHQNAPHLAAGMQFHPQAPGQGGQQGASNPQVIQPNAAAANQYVQPGTQHPYLMTGPMPIVQQIQQRPFAQTYPQMYQQTTQPYYSSSPQAVYMQMPPAQRQPFAPQQQQQQQQQQPPQQQPARQENQRNKKIIRIVDPTTNQDVTETLMRDASGSSSPVSGRSSTNVTPPVSTSNEDAKRIQATFAAKVAIVASDAPDLPPRSVPVAQPPKQPQQPPLQQSGPQPVPINAAIPPLVQVPPGGPVTVVPQIAPGGVPSVNPMAPPVAVIPQSQLPSQPAEPIPQEPAQVTGVAAKPMAEAAQPPRPANVVPVTKAGAPNVAPAEAPQLQQQPPARMQAPPAKQMPLQGPPVAVAPPAQIPAPVQPAPAVAPSNVHTAPPVKEAAKPEPPVASAAQNTVVPPPAATAPSKAPAVEQAPSDAGKPLAGNPAPVVTAGDASANTKVDSVVKENVTSANSPVQPAEPVQPQAQPVEKPAAANPAEAKESKKKNQKKRLQELEKRPAQNTDEFAAYKVEEESKEPAPASSQENPKKEAEVTSPPEEPSNPSTNPKDSSEKTEEKKTAEKPQQTTQPEEKVVSEKTEDVLQVDDAKRKKESDSVSEKPVEVVPETIPAKLDTDEKVEGSKPDERDTLNEADDVESENSKNTEGKPNPKDNKIQLKYSYREDQWSPVNPAGKKHYDRAFLLQFQKECTDKPDGLPHIPDIVLDKADVQRQLNLGQGMNQGKGIGSDFMPAFIKSPRIQGKAPNYPTGGSRRQSSKDIQQKIISRVSSSKDVELEKAENAWKPGHKRAEDVKDPSKMKTDELFRSFKSILNKLTPQKFAKLVEQAQKLPIDTEERLKGVTDLVFEKAISEPSFSTAYAHMCQRLSQIKVASSKQQGQMVQFRPILLHNCQREFEKEKQTEIDEAKRRKEIAQLPPDQREAQLELLDEKLFKAKRRTMGNMRFIGELYKLRILTENIMHECILKLLKAKDDDSLECLCNLMPTIGKDLDHEKAKNRMDQYFVQVDKIISSKKNPPRIRFLMSDLVDLRKSRWVPRRQEAKPQTIDAIHRDFNLQEAKKAEDAKNYKGPIMSRSREQNMPPRGPPQADDGWNTVPSAKTQRTIYDPAKLKLTRIQADDSIQLGPGGRGFNMWTRGSSGGSAKNQGSSDSPTSSQDEAPPQQANRFSMLSEDAKRPSRGSGGFGSRDSRGRGQSPISKRSSRERERDRDKEAALAEAQKISRGSRGSRPEIEPRGSREKISRPEKPEEPSMTDDKVEQKSKAIVDEFLNLRDFSEATRCVSELPSKQRHLFVQSTLDHIMEKKQDMREAVGVLFQKLITNNLLTNQQYLTGLSGVIEFAEDMAIDIPKIWEYLGEIQGAMVVGGVDFLKLQATAIKPLYEMNKAGILLAEILKTAARRIGAKDACHIWKSSGLQWEEFLPSGENAKEFVQSKGLEFTLDGASTADNGLNSVSGSQGDWLHVVNRGLTGVLKSKPDNNKIFDWIEDNLQASKKQHHDFIRALVTIVCQHTAEGEGQTCRIDPAGLKLRCPVLQRYIDNKRPLELQALYAVQALNHSLQNPPGLLGIIFDVLYDEDVISEEAFYDWKKSDDPQESTGKGVALKSVTSFFTWLTEAD